jgi:small subunit ribosomal protein S20
MSSNDDGKGLSRMANIKSQIKRNRQNEQRRQRNKSGRSFLKTKVKRFEQALQGGDAGAAGDAYRVVARELDKAASKGFIHRNKAANKKSRLAKRLNSSS